MLRKSFLLFVIAVIVFTFSLVSLVFRGREAFRGITWGLNKDVKALLNPLTETELVKTKVNLGVYDPSGILNDSDKFALEHQFLSWEKYDSVQLTQFLNGASSRGRWPILTVEPYPSEVGNLKKENLFSDILQGEYDSQIDGICTEIQTFGKPVFVRWGQEMENVTGRYPWAQNNAQGYVAAFRHFVDRCRGKSSQAYYVWSPVGNRNLEEYWPGREYVDYVGLSVFIYPQWEEINFKRVRSFREIFSEKYDLVKKYDRPIMIAEFGVTGKASVQEKVILQVFKDMGDFPLLKTVSFFNAKDTPGVWGNGVPTPDWTIDRDVLGKIIPVR